MTIEEDCIANLAQHRPRKELEESSANCSLLINGSCNWGAETEFERGDESHPECYFCVASRGPGSCNPDLMKAWENYR